MSIRLPAKAKILSVEGMILHNDEKVGDVVILTRRDTLLHVPNLYATEHLSSFGELGVHYELIDS